MIDPQKRPDHVMEDMIKTVAPAEARGEISVGEMIDRFGRRSFQPVLVFLGLVLVSPLSGIPGFSSIIGISIMLVAAQGALGRPSIWLPRFVLRRQITSEKLNRGLHRLDDVARWLDARTAPRFTWLTNEECGRLLMGLCAAGGLIIPVMEFLPFTSSIMGGGIALTALALLTRDGVLALGGLTAIGAALAVPLFVVMQVVEA